MAISYMHLEYHQICVHIYDQILPRFEEMFGVNDRRTLTLMSHFGCLKMEMKEYEGSLILMKQVLVGQKEIYGEYHPELVATMNNIAAAHLRMGSINLAIQHGGEAVQLMEKVFGKEHERTVQATAGLMTIKTMDS